MYILRTGRGDYLFGWEMGLPIFTDGREDAIHLSRDTLDETVISLIRLGYAVTPLEVD